MSIIFRLCDDKQQTRSTIYRVVPHLEHHGQPLGDAEVPPELGLLGQVHGRDGHPPRGELSRGLLDERQECLALRAVSPRVQPHKRGAAGL